MALLEEIKKGMFAAMKAQNTVEKEILRVAVGEITTAAGRESKDLDDDAIRALLRKLVKSNSEARDQANDPGTKDILGQEIAILQRYLPVSLSVDQIVEALTEARDQIKTAPSQGPAMGIAMKALKQAGKSADAKDVGAAVTKIRG